ncbi:hemolysin family protein [Thermaurantiacus sp.]
MWQALRNLLSLRSQPTTLRESLEEAIEEHVEDRDDREDLDAEEREMLRNMLGASERRAADIATPRGDIQALEIGTSFEQAVAFFHETGHTRVPLFKGSLDEVVGMLHMKDLFGILASGATSGPAIATLVRPVLFVPPGKPVLDLLADMRKARIHMAIVVDEFGGTDGLVTIEDIVEEIVGEIEDEHDEAGQALLRPLGDGLYAADARVALTDLQESLGVDFSAGDLTEDVDTLGGLAVVLAGRVPLPGDVLDHPNGWQLRIAEGDERRIQSLVLRPPTEGGHDS